MNEINDTSKSNSWIGPLFISVLCFRIEFVWSRGLGCHIERAIIAAGEDASAWTISSVHCSRQYFKDHQGAGSCRPDTPFDTI